MLGTPLLWDCLSGGKSWGGPLSSSQLAVQWKGWEGGRGSHQREEGLSPGSTWSRGLWGHVGQSHGHTRPPDSELWVVGDSGHPCPDWQRRFGPKLIPRFWWLCFPSVRGARGLLWSHSVSGDALGLCLLESRAGCGDGSASSKWETGGREAVPLFSPIVGDEWNEAQITGLEDEDGGYDFVGSPRATVIRHRRARSCEGWHHPPARSCVSPLPFPCVLCFSSLLPPAPVRSLPAQRLLTRSSDSNFAFKTIIKIQIFFCTSTCAAITTFTVEVSASAGTRWCSILPTHLSAEDPILPLPS